MEESKSTVVIDFRGQVTFNTISNLLPLLKEKLDEMGEKVNTYKRLLTITIEVMENCFRYIDNKFILKSYQADFPSFLKISKQDDIFIIEGGNTVLEEDVALLSQKINTVNSLDENGLRDLYKRTIANGQFSAVGGAGLGFIEIAKACGQKIDYTFEEIDQKIYYYKLLLEVKP